MPTGQGAPGTRRAPRRPGQVRQDSSLEPSGGARPCPHLDFRVRPPALREGIAVVCGGLHGRPRHWPRAPAALAEPRPQGRSGRAHRDLSLKGRSSDFVDGFPAWQSKSCVWVRLRPPEPSWPGRDTLWSLHSRLRALRPMPSASPGALALPAVNEGSFTQGIYPRGKN